MISFHPLVFKVRNKLNQVNIAYIDDIIVYQYLQESYDHIRMICDLLGVSIGDFENYKLERCIVNLATFQSYRNYTKLADRQLNTEPTSSAIQTTYDNTDAQTCLTLLFGVPITNELVPDLAAMNTLPTSGTMSRSALDLWVEKTW